MGGLACAIPRQAVLRFEHVPTGHKNEKEFDEQVRELYANSIISTAVATETTRGQEACDILGKDKFTHADRVALFEIVESLYESGA